MRKVFFLIIFLLGGGLLGISHFLEKTTTEGAHHLKKMEWMVEQKKLIPLEHLLPENREFERAQSELSHEMREQFEKGGDQITYFSQLARQLRIGGIGLAIIGIIGFFYSYFKKNNNPQSS